MADARDTLVQCAKMDSILSNQQAYPELQAVIIVVNEKSNTKAWATKRGSKAPSLCNLISQRMGKLQEVGLLDVKTSSVRFDER